MTATQTSLDLHRRHPRSYRDNRFVYPVLSRRSGGISIGINLNPDKICNFDCIYCQVDRRSEAETRFVESDRLLDELDFMIQFVESGEIYQDESFQKTPSALQRLNDIAFSGDGEPTTHQNFDHVVRDVVHLRKKHELVATKLVLITNASMFHRPGTQRALQLLDENNGEIWAKLEAGTDEYYQLVDRSKIPFQRILDNITAAAVVRPIVIQSLFMRINREPPSQDELGAFCGRLNDIVANQGQIKLVQVYTVARRPAESYVESLLDREVDQIAELIVSRTGLPTECYYG